MNQMQEITDQARGGPAHAVGPAASQAATIEQSRAVAEVYGAIMVARQAPRDEVRAFQKMREACNMRTLADRAFYRFPRGGEQVSGESIHLARELARCWGNIDYGIKELDRDDARGMSEMLAFAWDLETNARVEIAFLVPHKRSTRSGNKDLTDLRDIYENNANNGARRLRECIFAVIPPAFKEEAKARCYKTLESGGDKPLVQQIADMVGGFEALGVSKAQVERNRGKAIDHLTPPDLAQLRVIYAAVKRGETPIREEFPEDRDETAMREIAQQAAETGPAMPAADPPEPALPRVQVALDDDGNPNWLGFCNDFRSMLAAFPPDRHEALIEANAAQLGNLKAQAPDLYADLIGATD